MVDKVWDISKGQGDNFNIDLSTRLRKFKQEWGIEFLERLRPRTPVRTGELQAGWGFDMKQESIDVWSTTDYWKYVEFGTDKMEPRGMLRTTLLEAEQIAKVAKEKAGL